MKRAEERDEARASRWMLIALLGMVSICCLSLGSSTQGGASVQISRPDLAAVASTALVEELDRPRVQFPHDLHTGAMEERNEDCTICHLTEEDGRLSSRFKRLADTGEEEIMDLYHENCISCHEESASKGLEAGPVACGDCHRRHPAYVSSRQPFGFDKSLHYRHIKATDEKCDACHHLYDDTAKKLVYVEGKESSCRDCHRQEAEENRSAFKTAAHEQCIGCHREPAPELRKDSLGPHTCTGCHDEQSQSLIEKIEEPPRLKRNQPDFILVSASEADLESSRLRTVPFSHVDHEQRTASCRGCHHESLDACSECHTLKGGEKGDGVTLYRAMHGLLEEQSCTGCHETKKAAAECAGCHAPMEQGRLSEEGCDTCHAGPLPESVENERSRYRSIDDFRPGPSEMELSFAAAEIPETVTIGALSNEFQKAEMPHRKIANKLSQYIGESSVAIYFHGHEDVACQGCHHQSPVGEKPPLCESCHEAEAAQSDLLKPKLLGAYHRQCLGCHQSMDIREPSDCYGCHPAKEETAEVARSGAGQRRNN